MNDFRCMVSTAVDLSRLSNQNPIARIQLRRLLQIGKEVDLLESLRRSDKDEKLTLEMVMIYGANLDMDPAFIENVILSSFLEHKMINTDDEFVQLNYTDTSTVYQYGKTRLTKEIKENEKKLIELLCSASKNGIPITDLDETLELFSEQFRSGLRRFLLENNVLQEFSYKGIDYVTSPRIFKDTKKLEEAKEILTDHKFDKVIDFIEDNPGNPLSVVGEHVNVEQADLNLLGSTGIVDPVRLNVGGDVKDYLFASDILNKREDKDHFDLVRKTLANFRFGEYYSSSTRLVDLDRFFEYMLDHGYAGKAQPIGTDYMNLEWAGVFRIEKIPGSSNYRFWMLKRDVIEDARSVLHGYIPIKSSIENPSISNIDSVVQSRSKMSFSFNAQSKTSLLYALRQIEEGMSPS